MFNLIVQCDELTFGVSLSLLIFPSKLLPIQFMDEHGRKVGEQAHLITFRLLMGDIFHLLSLASPFLIAGSPTECATVICTDKASVELVINLRKHCFS
jgi:hypothetical protein